MTHSAIASCATFLFLPDFDVICRQFKSLLVCVPVTSEPFQLRLVIGWLMELGGVTHLHTNLHDIYQQVKIASDVI